MKIPKFKSKPASAADVTAERPWNLIEKVASLFSPFSHGIGGTLLEGVYCLERKDGTDINRLADKISNALKYAEMSPLSIIRLMI